VNLFIIFSGSLLIFHPKSEILILLTKFRECKAFGKGKRAFLKESCAKNFILRQPVCLGLYDGEGIFEIFRGVRLKFVRPVDVGLV